MPIIEDFTAYLQTQDRADSTVRAYTSDLRLFARWFQQTNGKEITPIRVTPIDLREYRQYLVTVKGYEASTINRKLAAISTWLKAILRKVP